MVKPNLIQTPNFENIQNWFLGKLPTLSFGPCVAQSSLDQKIKIKQMEAKMHKSWMHMNDLFINIQIENWDVTAYEFAGLPMRVSWDTYGVCY